MRIFLDAMNFSFSLAKVRKKMYFCNMISKNLMKYVRSLQYKKGRKELELFVAEGTKIVGDMMKVMNPSRIFATKEWWKENDLAPCEEDKVLSEEDLRRLSFLQHPQQVMALFNIPDESELQGLVHDWISDCHQGTNTNDSLFLALDDVQDPGNLGTIIRIADWFGISTIFCSPNTADAYNPKVVQATMGSIARVKIIYTDLVELLESLPTTIPVYGTFLDGTDIYQEPLSKNGIIVMGNEGKGISPAVAAHINRRLLIPHYPADKSTADSLNVAIATAITCSEFRRRS
jgi:TrmH family RNA methyltransferase